MRNTLDRRGARVISTPTVLVLGAGASAHCGYPLGSRLVDQLCLLRGSAELDDLPEGWSREEAEGFLTRLSRSAYYSIDAFLETNPDQARLGKYLLGRELKRHENLDGLFPPHDSGWYQFLFNSLLNPMGEPEFGANRLAVVTFNYDRSLEAYLCAALQNRCPLSPEEAESALSELEIVHVHGVLGRFPQVPYQPTTDVADLLNIADQIQIIHEMRDRAGGFCNSEFERAHELLVEAERIYFMGFGFHPDNMRRFQFFTPENTAGKEIKSTTHGWAPLDFANLTHRLAVNGITGVTRDGASCNQFFGYTAPLADSSV
jgi:hypothetical protein